MNRCWAVIFDLDETLVLTQALEPLRKRRNWTAVYENFRQTRLPEGTLQFIAKISLDARLGIVTKAPRTYAQKLVSYHGIDIPVLAAFHDVKKIKPDPEALLLASQKLGIQPNKCIYVGDDRNDVKAAQAAKFAPVGVCWGPKVEIGLDFVCTTWEEVHDNIRRIISE